MSEGFRPALTPEEWREFPSIDAMTHEVYALTESGHLWHPSIAGIAALALQRAGPDGKPLFTRADVEALREMLLDASVMHGDRLLGEDGARAAVLLAAAERAVENLSALLPPEEPE